jgi:hypothetical protein
MSPLISEIMLVCAASKGVVDRVHISPELSAITRGPAILPCDGASLCYKIIRLGPISHMDKRRLTWFGVLRSPQKRKAPNVRGPSRTYWSWVRLLERQDLRR